MRDKDSMIMRIFIITMLVLLILMALTILLSYLIFFLIIFFIASLKVIYEYERAVKFTLGRYSSIMQPGLNIVVPIIQSFQRVDMRVVAVDVPDQDAITADNVSIGVNAVLFSRVVDAKKAVLEVESYMYAVSQLSQTTMRDIIGEVSLDELLAKRDGISKRIKQIVDKATDNWGISIEAVELKHIEMPQDLKRVMGKEAEAEREKRAVITKSKGEVIAAENLAKAAKTMGAHPGGLHIRTLQSLNDISSDQSNTIVFAIPLEVLRAFEKTSEVAVKKAKKTK